MDNNYLNFVKRENKHLLYEVSNSELSLHVISNINNATTIDYNYINLVINRRALSDIIKHDSGSKYCIEKIVLIRVIYLYGGSEIFIKDCNKPRIDNKISVKLEKIVNDIKKECLNKFVSFFEDEIKERKRFYEKNLSTHKRLLSEFRTKHKSALKRI